MTRRKAGLTKDSYGKTFMIEFHDGTATEGILLEMISEADNEPDGECLVMKTADFPFVDILMSEIKSIAPVLNPDEGVIISDVRFVGLKQH
jgi:hypothetical protein